MNARLKALCDITTESHTRIQKDFADINPMVGVNQKMREMSVPVDAITIDCLKNGKRILLILHDHHPEIIRYQFTYKNQDPDENFKEIQSEELTGEQLYNWIKNYFQRDTNQDATSTKQ